MSCDTAYLLNDMRKFLYIHPAWLSLILNTEAAGKITSVGNFDIDSLKSHKRSFFSLILPQLIKQRNKKAIFAFVSKSTFSAKT